ncbi:rhomboid family intramembrane serine protease GlpG [Thalassotalea euphylliae]|uniref:Rhomboid family intramembrane serine protease GlpG n=1 Tax=Thalassotalea euphylliae TaxID=1655234 RepID=A0A3E0UAM9_9GAMM|nr:rhomboid family intramembrane serine protease GlpG [Thalassotalea euphylliae]REL33959.1 rhomboid family intramembrane serine protease GlpG [Thalassotalea euphylliae]
MDSLPLQPLVKVDQQAIGQLFVDYLCSLEIPAKLVEQDHAHWICVATNQVEQAKQLFNEFALQPYHPKYQQAAQQHSGAQTSMPSHAFSGVKQQFFAQAGPFTLIVFGTCWLVYILANLGLGRDLFSSLSFYSQLDVQRLVTEPWRLIGPAFLHFSLLHIAFNTLWWWQLGGAIERIFGRWQIVNLFLLSAIASNVGQFIVSGPNFGGLSGVVYAVVGFAWFAGWLMPERGVGLSKSIVGFLLIWLLLGFVDVLPINMANTAHLVGLVVGCAMAWLIAKRQKAI